MAQIQCPGCDRYWDVKEIFRPGVCPACGGAMHDRGAGYNPRQGEILGNMNPTGTQIKKMSEKDYLAQRLEEDRKRFKL